MPREQLLDAESAAEFSERKSVIIRNVVSSKFWTCGPCVAPIQTIQNSTI